MSELRLEAVDIYDRVFDVIDLRDGVSIDEMIAKGKVLRELAELQGYLVGDVEIKLSNAPATQDNVEEDPLQLDSRIGHAIALALHEVRPAPYLTLVTDSETAS